MPELSADRPIGTSSTATPAELATAMQGAAVTSAATTTTVGANTGTAGAGLSLIGNTTSVDQAANLMNDLAALQEDILDVKTQLNALIVSLEGANLIAS